MHYFSRYLKNNHKLYLFAFADSEEEKKRIKDSPAVGENFTDVVFAPKPPIPGWLGKQHHRLKIMPNFVESVRNPQYTKRVIELVGESYQKFSCSLIFARGINMAQYFPSDSDFPIVLDIVDSLSLLFKTLSTVETSISKKILHKMEAFGTARVEKSIAKTGIPLVVISPVDEQNIQRAWPGANTSVISNGIDTEYFQSTNLVSESKTILFTGVMSYEPNIDAASYFATKILPALRKRDPEIEFLIVGKDPTSDVVELAQLENVTVTGTVADIRPYYDDSRIFVSPLRAGAGMKNKVLTAMAMHRPVIATALSLDGIDATPGKELITAETPDEFAKEILCLLEDQNACLELSKKGRKFVEKNFLWRKKVEQLETIFQTIV